MDFKPTLAEIEKREILQRFELFNRNRTQTARSLGIGIRTLQRKLAKWGIPKGTTVREFSKDSAPKNFYGGIL